MNTGNVEIERKWLMEGFPENVELLDECEMEQGYLAFQPVTVRIRKSAGAQGESHVLTIKGKGGLSRTEVETPLDKSQYEALRELLPIPPVKKQRRCFALPTGEVLECSHVDEGECTAFYYAEVEFGTEEEARCFVPPAWLGREVTDEPGWTMAAYCRRKHGAGAEV